MLFEKSNKKNCFWSNFEVRKLLGHSQCFIQNFIFVVFQNNFEYFLMSDKQLILKKEYLSPIYPDVQCVFFQNNSKNK